jgi:hypothetical protein
MIPSILPQTSLTIAVKMAKSARSTSRIKILATPLKSALIQSEDMVINRQEGAKKAEQLMLGFHIANTGGREDNGCGTEAGDGTEGIDQYFGDEKIEKKIHEMKKNQTQENGDAANIGNNIEAIAHNLVDEKIDKKINEMKKNDIQENGNGANIGNNTEAIDSNFGHEKNERKINEMKKNEKQKNDNLGEGANIGDIPKQMV